MAVDAVYLLDERKRIRRVIVWGAHELIHDEATYELDAEIDGKYGAKPGEFLGFFDVDKKLRLFEIDTAELDDRRGVTSITATDAAVSELAHLIAEEIRLTGKTAKEAAKAALSGSAWKLGNATSKSKKADVSAYMDTRWKVLRDIAALYQVRITPYFKIENGEIAGRYVDVTERENVFRGRLLEGRNGNAQIYVTRSGVPITRMYGVGKATGTEDPPSCVTFADITASDKPKGKTYIEDAAAIARYGNGREDVFTDKNITDPKELLDRTREELKKRTKPKVSGSATASDMEHIPGHEHKIVRMYDMIWVRTKTGEDVSAVVINVKRNYLRRGMTKFTLGEEADDSAASIGLIGKVAKISSESNRLGRSSSSASNRYIETKQLIQLNTDTIQMNARLIEANAEQIQLEAMKIDEVSGRVTSAELELYGDGTSARAGLVARVNDNAALIAATATELETKIALKADKIELKGLVTASELNAEIAAIKKFFAGNATAAKMIVTNLGAVKLSVSDSFSFKSSPVDWQSGYMVASKYLPNYEYVSLMRGDGSTGMYYVFHDRPTVNIESVNYLGN